MRRKQKTKESTKKLYKCLGVLALTLACGAQVANSVSIGATSNEASIYSLLTKTYGYNTAAASGILSNLYHESGFNPVAKSGPSIGLCQWLGSRKTALYNFASSHGYSAYSLEGQVAFLNYELKNSYTSVYNYLHSVDNTASGAYNAAYRFCYSYERPANKAYRSAQRGNSAKNTYFVKYKNSGTILAQGVSSSTDDDDDTKTVSMATSKTTVTRTSAAKYSKGTYQTNLDMKVRKGATMSSKVVGYVSRGATLKVSSVKNKKWGKITYNGKKAYVSLKYSTKQ